MSNPTDSLVREFTENAGLVICGAKHPNGRRCKASVLHAFAHPDRQAHCFYEMGWPIEWTDETPGAIPSPWPEFVGRLANARRPVPSGEAEGEAQ